MVDMAKIRRENMRWYLLVVLNHARPSGISDKIILMTVRGVHKDAKRREVRVELDYLRDRGLVTIREEPDGGWWCDLTRYGVDLVEYTVPCDPGIARPEKTDEEE